MKRSIIFLAGFFCVLLVTCDNIFYTIASSGEKELEISEYIGEYIVKFNKNEGDTEASPQVMSVIPPATTVMLPSVEPKWGGHLFTGWNTKANGSGTPFTRNTPVKANITVYAQWFELPISSFIVHFNKNNTDDNSLEASPQMKAAISPNFTIDALPAEPKRIGYDFIGWNMDIDGTGGEFTKNTTVSAVTTVFAQWKPITYTILYNKNAGDASGSTASSTHTYDTDKMLTINGFSRPGYIFAGWASSPTGTRVYADGENVKNLTTIQGSTITLYACWSFSSFSISFNLNGASGSPPPTQTVESGNSITLPSGDGLSRSGYNFGGWNTQKDGYGINYDGNTSYTPSGSIRDIILYAQWNAIITTPKYTVIFDSNGGTGTGPNSQTVDAGSGITLPSEEGLVKSGFTFDGWNTKTDGSGNNYNAGEYYTPSGNSILYAQWNEDGGTIPPPPTPTTVNGTVALADGGEGNIEDVLVQLYQLVLPSDLVPIGSPKKPTELGAFSFTDLTANATYFITASLDGYITEAITVLPPHPPSVNLVLSPGVETRRASQSIDLQQLLMQLIQSEDQ